MVIDRSKWMTFGELARLLSLDPDTGRETIRHLASAGQIKATEVKPGVWRIDRAEGTRLAELSRGGGRTV